MSSFARKEIEDDKALEEARNAVLAKLLPGQPRPALAEDVLRDARLECRRRVSALYEANSFRDSIHQHHSAVREQYGGNWKLDSSELEDNDGEEEEEEEVLEGSSGHSPDPRQAPAAARHARPTRHVSFAASRNAAVSSPPASLLPGHAVASHGVPSAAAGSEPGRPAISPWGAAALPNSSGNSSRGRLSLYEASRLLGASRRRRASTSDCFADPVLAELAAAASAASAVDSIARPDWANRMAGLAKPDQSRLLHVLHTNPDPAAFVAAAAELLDSRVAADGDSGLLFPSIPAQSDSRRRRSVDALLHLPSFDSASSMEAGSGSKNTTSTSRRAFLSALPVSRSVQSLPPSSAAASTGLDSVASPLSSFGGLGQRVISRNVSHAARGDEEQERQQHPPHVPPISKAPPRASTFDSAAERLVVTCAAGERLLPHARLEGLASGLAGGAIGVGAGAGSAGGAGGSSSRTLRGLVGLGSRNQAQRQDISSHSSQGHVPTFRSATESLSSETVNRVQLSSASHSAAGERHLMRDRSRAAADPSSVDAPTGGTHLPQVPQQRRTGRRASLDETWLASQQSAAAAAAAGVGGWTAAEAAGQAGERRGVHGSGGVDRRQQQQQHPQREEDVEAGVLTKIFRALHGGRKHP